MLLVVDAAVVRARSYESALGSDTHNSSTGRKDCASRRDTEPESGGAAHWVGRLVDCRRIMRQGLGDVVIKGVKSS